MQPLSPFQLPFQPGSPSTLAVPTPGIPTPQNSAALNAVLTAPNMQAANMEAATLNKTAAASGVPNTNAPAPVNISSFTPAQLAAFNAANALGTGVATTGTPPLSAQSSAISSGAGNNTLTNQLYNGAGGINTTSYTGINPTTGQSNGAGATTTMYTSQGTPVQIPTSNVSSNTYSQTNPNGYYATNPTVAPPNLASTTPSVTPATAPDTQAQFLQNAQTVQGELEQSEQNEANTTAGIDEQPIPLEFQQGQAQVEQGQYQQQQAALGSEYQGDVAAASAAAPVSQYGQLINPLTGDPISGGSAGSLNPVNAIPTLAQDVENGTMSVADAESQLTSSGIPATALTEAIQQGDPSFNFNQAEENSDIQGTIVPATANANAQLANLQTTLKNAPPELQTSIPALNNLIQTLSSVTGVGAGESQSIQSAITDARTSMANALESANGLTPSAASSYVQTLIPDGATLAQVTAGIQQFNTQIAGKLAAYGNPGNTTTSTGSGSSTFTNGQTVNVGGTNYTINNGVWSVAH